MQIVLVSTLPEVLGFLGLRHHHPGPGGPADGLTILEADPPDERAVGGLLRVAGGTETTVFHLTGSSGHTARIAAELRTRSVPYIFSPMLPSLPGPFRRLLAVIPGVSAPEDLRFARTIAASASAVVVTDDAAKEALARFAGVAGPAVHVVPPPAAAGSVLPAPGDAPGGPSAPRAAGNLAVAFSDALTAEWNVLNFIFAMEKINADAVIVAGRSGEGYASACLERATSNPRMSVLAFDRGSVHSIAPDVAALLGKATIVVDPSRRGLAGALAGAAAAAGIPSVVSRSSIVAAGAGRSPVHTFEPTSWELLNHAITSAFNRAVARGPAGDRRPSPEATAGGAGVAPADANRAIAASLGRLYREAASR